uniref:Uncharacterized protein n=1 Tax=Setaria italica TaxID=4555 RepID=K3ZGM5_SETIT
MSIETNVEDDSSDEVYVKHSSSLLLTYAGLSEPLLVRGSEPSSPLSTNKSVYANLLDDQDQYTTKGGLRRLWDNIPLESSSRM